MDVLLPRLSAVIDDTVLSLLSLVKEEFRLINDVDKYIQQLRENLDTFKQFIKEAEKIRLDEGESRVWFMKLKDAVNDADDILDIFNTEACLWKRKQLLKNPSAGLMKILKKSEISKKVKEVSNKLEEIGRKRMTLNLGGLHGSASGGCRHCSDQQHDLTTPTIDIEDVIGRDDDKEKLVELLLSDEHSEQGKVSVIPIIGMGGLGKTTLAQYVFNDERIKECFKLTMWVCVTADYSLPRILRYMIESHTKITCPDSLAVHILESRLLEILDGNKFLLVLDDVWMIQDYGEWEKLKKILEKGAKGSRVLVTSRLQEVCRITSTQEPFHLWYLSEDQCWSLFEKIVFVNPNMIPRYLRKELEDIGRKIVSKCQGLPLAVKSMAYLLRNCTDVAKWNDILSSSVWELDNQDSNSCQTPNILPALKLSYDYLPSHLKPCFNYCAIFPKACVFIKEDLVKLWVAQGYINPSRQKTAEEIGIEYFHRLLARFFFETAKTEDCERYKMHDLVHDLALLISSPHCCQVKDFKPNKGLEGLGCTSETRHISLLDQDVEQATLMVTNTCEKARTLLLPLDCTKNFGEALTKIFSSLELLRTLDLSSGVLTELPSAIEKLKLLRYLDLSRTDIEVLPDSICNLYNLQVLKLLGCVSLFCLPADFSELVNLCYLELEKMFWFKCSVLPPRIGNLSRLRNWHAFRIGREEGYRISELGNMELLTGELHILQLENAMNAADAKLGMKPHFQKLVLEWSIKRDVSPEAEAAEERVLEDLQPHQNISELQINNCAGGRIPTWMIDDHLQNVVTLSLTNCTKFRILSLGHLRNLCQLFIKGLQELEELYAKDGFFSLRQLKISRCPKLRKLPKVLLNLKVLKIKKCDSLQALPITPSLYFSILMDNLTLEDWNEQFIQITCQDDQGQSMKQPPRPCFIQLIELKVVNCPRLCDLPQYFAPQKLDIHQCQGIRSLPKPEFAQRLQQLALSSCPDMTLVRAIPRTSSLFALVISDVSNLTSFPSWPELSGLQALYISYCQDLSALPERGTEGSLQSLSSLSFLSIHGCPKLTSLPHDGLPTNLNCLVIDSCSALNHLGGPQTLRSLASLKDLCIQNCPLIESFPEHGFNENLKHLSIKGCPSLLKHCQDTNIISNIDLETDHIKPPSVQTPHIPPITTPAEQRIQRCLPFSQVFLRCLGH